MADQDNIRSRITLDIEIDFSDNADFAAVTMIESETTDPQQSYPGYSAESASAVDGTVYTAVGEKGANEKTYKILYTEGETTDTITTAKAAEGLTNIAVREHPSGKGSGNDYYQTTGVLSAVTDPYVDGAFQYFDIVLSGASTTGTTV